MNKHECMLIVIFFFFFLLPLFPQDVGEGWWEGVNSSGQKGLFPAGYVEVSLTSRFYLLTNLITLFLHHLY